MLLYSTLKVPSAPPTDVIVSVDSGTSITLQWGPVECTDQNGEIIGFSVRYWDNERDSEGDRTIKMVPGDSSGGMTTISGLNIRTVYTFEVAAVTSAGTGIYCVAETIETLSCE